MKNRIVLFLLSAACLFCGCGNKKSICFKGTVSEADGRFMVVSRVGPDGTEVLDSARIEKGCFKLVIPTQDAEPAFYCLSLSEDNGFTTLARQGETLTLKAESGSLVRSYHITGGEDAALMEKLDRQLSLFADSVETLRELFLSTGNDTVHAQIEKAYLQLKANHTAFLRDFILQNMHSLACMPAFYQCYDNAVFFDEKQDAKLLLQMAEALKKKYPDNLNVKWLEKEIQNIK